MNARKTAKSKPGSIARCANQVRCRDWIARFDAARVGAHRGRGQRAPHPGVRRRRRAASMRRAGCSSATSIGIAVAALLVRVLRAAACSAVSSVATCRCPRSPAPDRRRMLMTCGAWSITVVALGVRTDVHAARPPAARRIHSDFGGLQPGFVALHARQSLLDSAPRGTDRPRVPSSQRAENVLQRIRHRSPVRSRARAPPPGHVHRHLAAQSSRARSHRQLGRRSARRARQGNQRHAAQGQLLVRGGRRPRHAGGHPSRRRR